MKSNKIEKLILDLSIRWEVNPEEVVDRLNSMNESEINKLINSMTKKFKNGGFIDCLRNGGSVSKCKCGCDKIAKAGNGLSGIPNVFETNTPQGGKYRLSGYTLNPNTRTTKEEIFSPSGKLVSERVISRGDTLGTDNGSRFNVFMDRLKRDSIAKENPKLLNFLEGTEKFDNGGKTSPVGATNVRPRTDKRGTAYSLGNKQVLISDAVGPQPLPGSNYEIEGSSPEMETQRVPFYDKDGNVGYKVKVFNNSGDQFFPVAKYRSDYKPWHKLLGWGPYNGHVDEAFNQNGFSSEPKAKPERPVKTAPVVSIFSGLNQPSIDFSQMYKKGGCLPKKKTNKIKK